MIPGIVAAQASTAATQTVFSATNKAADINLLNLARDAESTSAGNTGGIVLSVSSKNSGKYYAEFSNVQSFSSGTALAAGMHRNTATLAAFLGQNANGWATWIEGTGGGNRRTYNNNVATNLAPLALSLNQIARLAVDFSTGQIWLAHFGISGWVGGGDPALGTAPTYTFTVGSDAYYLSACPRGGGSSGNRNTIRLVQPSSWAYAAPSGFIAWL